MKAIGIISFLISLALNSSSQITKNNWLVGGNAAFSSTDYKSDLGSKSTYIAFEFSPNVGYLIIDKLATGLRIGFFNAKQKALGTSASSRYTSFSYGPFVRYYFLKTTAQTNLLFEISYQHGTEKATGYENDKNTFSFATGPVLYLNTVVGVEFLVGYSTSKYAGFSGNNNTFMISVGFQIHLEKEVRI
jgi:hypothetical protein